MFHLNLLSTILICIELMAFIQCIQISRLETRLKAHKDFVHILEEELDSIHREQDLMVDWMNETDVIIAGLNDGNQKRRSNLSPA